MFDSRSRNSGKNLAREIITKDGIDDDDALLEAAIIVDDGWED